MKKLFMMVALSLVMVACNKDENELSYWDKVLNEMGETKLSAIDVLESLRENEHWEITTEYKYFLRDGKVVEEMTSGEGLFVTANPTALRFADNKMYSYYMTGPDHIRYYVSDVEETDEGIKYYDENGEARGEWKIIGYDDNKILYEGHPLTKQEPAPKGEYLYSRTLRERKVDDSKWWEEAELIY